MKFKTESEINDQLAILLQNISKSFHEKQPIKVNNDFQVLWNYFYNAKLIKTTKKRNEMILPVLFDIITEYPIFVPKIQTRACALFCKLVRKPQYRPDNLYFPIKKVLYIYKMLFCTKERLFILKKKKDEYFTFFFNVRFFFNEDDARYLIQNNFYRLGNPDELSLKSLMLICRFFPPQYYKMIIKDLIILLKNSTSQTHSNAIISFINQCIIYDNFQYSQAILNNKNLENKFVDFERFDWTPFLDIFFNYALLFLNPKVNINGLNFSAGSQLKSISFTGITDCFDFNYIDYISKTITLLIVDGKQGDEALSYFDKFINILTPLFFKSSDAGSINQVKREDFGNTSKLVIIGNSHEIEFALFIQLVISEFHKNNIKALRKRILSEDNSGPTSYANPHQIKEFVRIVLPVIQTAIFRSNQYIQKLLLDSIIFLAELDFHQVGHLLLEQSVDNINDIEMSHFSLSCIEIVKQLIPSIVTDKRALAETKDLFPKIIYSSIECLSNVNENIFTIGLAIIGIICQFCEADDKRNELTPDDIQKVESCRKTIIQCLENTFDQYIEYTISHEENSKDSTDVIMTENQMIPYYFSSYFMSFEDSFIESKAPFLIDTIDQNIDKSSISNVFYSLFDSKPNISKILIPKMLDRLDKAINDKDKKKKKYYSLMLSQLSIFSPIFVPFIDEYKKRVDILIEECTLNSFKCVSSLLLFVRSFAIHNNFFLVNDQPINVKGIIINDKGKISQKKWEWLGKRIENLKVIDFQLTDEFQIEQLNYFIKTLQKLSKIFFQEDDELNENDKKNSKSINFKIQKTILLIFQIFISIYELKGKFLQFEPRSFKNLTEGSPGVTQIDLLIKEIELITRDLIIKGIQKYKSQKYYNLQKLLLFAKFTDKYLFQSSKDAFMNTASISAADNFKFKFKNKGKKIMIYKLAAPFAISSMIKYLYKSEFDEEIIELLYEISHTTNTALLDAAVSEVSFFGSCIEKCYIDIPIKELTVIETKKKITSLMSSSCLSNMNEHSIVDKIKQSNSEIINANNNNNSSDNNDDDVLTQEQCITALAYLALTFPFKLVYENEYLARLLKAIVSIKFDPKWNISKYLFNLLNSISFIRDNFEIKDDKAWRDLIDSIIPSMKKPKEIGTDESETNEPASSQNFYVSSHDIFFAILDIIAFQKPPISPKFFKFLIKSCFNVYEPNRLGCLLSLSNLFARMKPHAKKVQIKEITEDFIIDERCTLYFTDYEPLFTVSEGSSQFDESDGFHELREVIFDFFNAENLSYLIDSIAFFLNEKNPSNEEESNNQSDGLVVIFECFWKGLSMILRSKFILFVKDKLIEIALNKSGPLLCLLFSIIKGIWRSSKHWTEEELSVLKNELFIPILHIIFFRRNSADAYQMLESTATLFCSKRDFHRLNWLFDFIMNSIKEVSKNENDQQSLSEEKENILSHLIDFAASLFYSIYDSGFTNQYICYFKEKVLPAFGNKTTFDFNNHTIAAISSLSKFSCSFINTNFITKNDDDDDVKWASIPFEEIFDVQFKNKRYDKLAVFLIELITPASLGLKSFIPFISDRIVQIFTILANLTTKFQNSGAQLVLQVGLLNWEKYPDLLVNNVLMKIKDVIIPSLTVIQHGWWIKCNIVTFLHVLCLRNLFILPTEIYKMIMKEILPLLICEKNENVRELSFNLLIFLVSVVYGGKFDILSHECLEAFKKNKTNEEMNEEFATATACAMLSNLSTLMNACPKWLPLIFNELENVYFRGTSFKNVIQKSVKEFWARHGFREIPELEEYRFSLCESYYA